MVVIARTRRDLLFLTFLWSRPGSLRARMQRAEAEGTTETVAARFWIVSLTVTLRPFQSLVPLAISSPTFFGDRPSGPILGASDDVAPTSPPTARRHTAGEKTQERQRWGSWPRVSGMPKAGRTHQS